MNFITVPEATHIIQSQTRDFGVEDVSYETALGRILAEDLFADRDLPPFNRPAVDGIAINYKGYEDGIHSFKIKATQAAGERPVPISEKDECIEIMTGAALDPSVDTVVRYEDINISNRTATVKNIPVQKGQHVHLRGKDKKEGDTVADAGRIITPALAGLAASIGKTNLLVKKLPRVAVITTGDEMVSPEEIPTPYQLRRSNGITLRSAIAKYGIQAGMIHFKDDYDVIRNGLDQCLDIYDILLMSGGVSMGKFDHVPQALEELAVKKLFHKVKQRPGKPFWFGTYGNRTLVFAFPGNPVSAFMCLHRYFIPWLEVSLGIKPSLPEYAVLQNNIHFSPPLQYFAQVRLKVTDRGLLTASAVEGNGSGDFSNLISTDAFMELPLEKKEFKKGEVYKIWRYVIF